MKNYWLDVAIRKQCLYADLHVDKYKEDPIVAGQKLADLWCEIPSKQVELWGCEFCSHKFFIKFLDVCREKGRLEEALKIWWLVHNCPGGETEPCFHDYVCQWVIDYSKEYGLESHTEWLRPYNLDKYQHFFDLGGTHIFDWWDLNNRDEVRKRVISRFAYIYPNPRDEKGRFIPQIKDKRTGGTIGWPRGEDGRFLTVDQLDELGI